MRYSEEKLGVGKELLEENVAVTQRKKEAKNLFVFLKAHPAPHLSSPKVPYSISR